MLSLPTLAPRDSHTLWYTSSNSASHPSPHIESANNAFDHLTSNLAHGQNAGQHPHRRLHTLHRSPLARLRHDEEYIERRKQNIQNYGNSWIKPPGVPKSLYQLREEKREMEEHQEALRREALAQELAEAAAEGTGELLQGEGMDGEMEEGRDLDDDVPEADITRLDGDSEAEDLEHEVEEVPRGVLASRIPDDVYREALVRGEDLGSTRFGDEGGSTVDEEDASHMLQEEDLVHEAHRDPHAMDIDMDADLDADIPEAGGYEHTDTEAEFSSSSSNDDDDDDDRSQDVGLLPRGHHQASTSMVRSDGTQNSMDLTSLISYGSSQVGSSPGHRSGLRVHRGGH